MTKRTSEGAAAAAAGAETEFGIFLPDIARDAGIPLAALEAEVTAKRLPTFEGSFECGDPREYWSAGPVEIAVWLARPATPGDLRDRIAAWNETVFSPWRSVRQPAGGPRNLPSRMPWAAGQVQPHQPAIQQPLRGQRDLRLAGLRTAAAGLQRKPRRHARKGREEHVEFITADGVPLRRGEPGDHRLAITGCHVVLMGRDYSCSRPSPAMRS